MRKKRPCFTTAMLSRFSKMLALVPTLAASLVLFAGMASAHVTVKPNSTAPGAWETYTIKVPVEKDIPTVKVSLKIPEGLDFKQYRAVPDWKIELTKNSTDRITVVTWIAEGEGILPGEFQQFDFVAKNPGSDAELAWDAFQYYSDGSIVEWTGDAGSEKPHSITQVTLQDTGVGSPAGTSQHSHDHDHDQSGSSNPGLAGDHDAEQEHAQNSNNAVEATAGVLSEPAQEGAAPGDVVSDAASSSAGSANIWTIALSSAALLLSIIALGITLLRTKKSA